jgi:2-phosphoglycerate kinase
MKRNETKWTVLFIGGASGTGKSTLAYEIAKSYGINVLEADDIGQALKASTNKEILPIIHYWSNGINWTDTGVEENKNWLINVSKEISPALKAVADRHIEDKVPIIIEGDFVYPELTLSFNNPQVKTLYLIESDKEQILKNYFNREGGELQTYRAEISIAHENWIKTECIKNGIKYIESRPWKTLLKRAVRSIDE